VFARARTWCYDPSPQQTSFDLVIAFIPRLECRLHERSANNRQLGHSMKEWIILLRRLCREDAEWTTQRTRVFGASPARGRK
jgi:hypothetical protein